MYKANILHNFFESFSKEIPFLKKSAETCVQKKPYKGLKILQNIPLTKEAVLKICPFVFSEAQIDVRVFSLLPPDEKALNLFREANVKVIFPNEPLVDVYDFHLDCCAELLNSPPPKIGTIELTQTGSVIYKNSALEKPVISVDDCELKYLETTLGTGDGFVSSFKKIITEELYNKKFVIFGYGKVGRGIAFSLLKFTDKITVIDISEAQRNSAQKKGIYSISPENIADIKAALKDAFCVITATGVTHLITEYYELDKEDFGKALLTNMGGTDEYGNNFAAQDVLFGKKTFNFMSETPTPLEYLDPVFYCHNMGIDLMLKYPYENGYYPFPSEIALKVIEEWKKTHGKEYINFMEYH
jgi:adenosylhomocysteinase